MILNTREFTGYFLVVLIGLGVDYGILYSLTTFTPMWYFYATAISFTLALISNYLLAHYLVFAQLTAKRSIRNFAVFAVVGTSTLVLNQIAMYLLVDYVMLTLFLAKTLTLPITFSLNYLASKTFVFSGGQNKN